MDTALHGKLAPCTSKTSARCSKQEQTWSMRQLKGSTDMEEPRLEMEEPALDSFLDEPSTGRSGDPPDTPDCL